MVLSSSVRRPLDWEPPVCNYTCSEPDPIPTGGKSFSGKFFEFGFWYSSAGYVKATAAQISVEPKSSGGFQKFQWRFMRCDGADWRTFSGLGAPEWICATGYSGEAWQNKIHIKIQIKIRSIKNVSLNILVFVLPLCFPPTFQVFGSVRRWRRVTSIRTAWPSLLCPNLKRFHCNFLEQGE